MTFVSRLATLHDVFIYKYISYFVVSCFLGKGGILHELLILQSDALSFWKFCLFLLWVHQREEGEKDGESSNRAGKRESEDGQCHNSNSG